MGIGPWAQHELVKQARQVERSRMRRLINRCHSQLMEQGELLSSEFIDEQFKILIKNLYPKKKKQLKVKNK